MIASEKNWIEGAAFQQLEKTASLAGMRLAVGLPDLHPGKGSPIGTAFLTEAWIYPVLVGNDIGCGIGLWRTDLGAKGIKREAWGERLRGLDDAWDGDVGRFLEERGIDPSGYESSLGTIGGGNHFAELQVVENIVNEGECANLGVDRNDIYLWVHSGSRGFGELILREHVARFGAEGLQSTSDDAAKYLSNHDHAKHWALANRELIALRILDRLRTNGVRLYRQWKEALNAGSAKQMVDGVRLADEALPRGFVVRNTIAALFFQAAYIFVLVVEGLMRALGRARPRSDEDWLHSILLLFGIAALVSLPSACLAVWRLLRHGTPERSVSQIGRVVLEALEFSGCIDSRAGDFRVYADKNEDGTVFCWVGGGTGKEQTAFLQAMRQTLGPIENPRYLLARRRIWRVFHEDYFAVPEALARKKEYAEFFAKQWRKLVGPVNLVFTRSPEGRQLLLRARGHSLAAAFQKPSERVSCWK